LEGEARSSLNPKPMIILSSDYLVVITEEKDSMGGRGTPWG
jgi:hypothetical protein